MVEIISQLPDGVGVFFFAFLAACSLILFVKKYILADFVQIAKVLEKISKKVENINLAQGQQVEEILRIMYEMLAVIKECENKRE